MGNESVEIGSKWTFARAEMGNSFEVIEPYDRIPAGFVHVRWDDGQEGIIRPAEILADYRRLGTSQDAEPAKGGPGVHAGQRRQWNVGDGARCFGPFTVHESPKRPGDFTICYDGRDVDTRCYPWTGEMLAAQSTLLDAAPPVEPAALKHYGNPAECTYCTGGIACPHWSAPVNAQPDPVARTPVPIHREVSGDGRNWINYDRLTDADPFTSYRHRRENGVVAAVVESSGVRVGVYDAMLRDRAERPKMPASTDLPAVEPAPEHPRQSHATTWGGVWSLRAGR